MGEFELLAKLRERLPPAGPRVRLGSGDDAAVTVPGGATATSVDAIVEGVHFRRTEAPPQTIGRKALAVALSDLAAMGAEAGEAYVVLGAPSDLGEEEFGALLDGLLAVATETGTTLAGGDLTRAPVLTLAVTVVGHAGEPEDLVPRSGARPGEVLVVTGELGGAAAGRLLLERPELEKAVAQATADLLRARQLDPTPRLRSGRALAAAGARAMIDLSDGLAGDGPAASGCTSTPDRFPSRRASPRSPPRPGKIRCSWPPPAAKTTSCWRRCRHHAWSRRPLSSAPQPKPRSPRSAR
jgi:thiamine-monophosphate kinase